MKNKFLLTFMVVSLIVFALFSASCGNDEKYTGIETPNLAYKDGAYTLTVSSDVNSFDLSSIFSISENASYTLSQNEAFSSTIQGDVELSVGENRYYLKVTDVNGNEAVYRFVITKKNTFNVTFNVNGGSQIANIQCEDGQVIEAPVSLKPGYTLEWDYDFSNPIIKDTIITATWIPNAYKITIDGTDIVIDVKYGESYEVTAPERVGYKFTGWQSDGLAFDASSPYSVEGDTTLVPMYEIEQFTINYITLGGVNNNPTVYTVEDEVVFENLIWQTNGTEAFTYEFAGWYKDAQYTIPLEKIEKGSIGSVDVYGKWIITEIPEEKNETSVTVLAPGFECDGTTLVFTAGEDYILPELTKDGYILVGWESEDGKIPLQATGVWALTDDALTVVPLWTERTYSITYILNGGANDENNVNSYTITSEIELLNPTKQYSEFDGWYTDEAFTNRLDKIVEGSYGDIVLYAKWNEISYNISYNANFGEVSQVLQKVILGSNYALLTPVRNGYAFNGWFQDGEEEPFANEGQWLFENDVNLTAKWTIITYNISYELNGGTASGLVSKYNVETKNFVLPKPTKDGQLFLGWSLNDGPINSNTVVVKGSVGDRNYVANWCDAKDSLGFMYTIANGAAMVVGYQGEIGANVKIPAEFNGYPVVAIANKAFYGYGQKLANLSSNSGFTTMLIPNTITRIGSNAFNDCADLKVLLYNPEKEEDDNMATEEEINAWEQSVVVESENDHLIDVIKGKRPAIGWKVYTK